MAPPAPTTPDGLLRFSRYLASAISRELDRLDWSSETAPPGEQCLEAFPATPGHGVVAVDGPEGTCCYDGLPLLQHLVDLEPPLTWEAMLAALRPYALL